MREYLILDAMGVIYKSGDDVAELLVPFIQHRNPRISEQFIQNAYMLASLGQITAKMFWHNMNMSPDVEDEYLQGHELQPGVLEFLDWAVTKFKQIMCLSNDVSEWSRKLRSRFGLERYIQRWYISGELHSRKPSTEIYQAMVGACHYDARSLVFVDDRAKNLLPACDMGIKTVLFGHASQSVSSDLFQRAKNFRELKAALSEDEPAET
jgi:HAD superfamily hydrolase (TIGR01509 family)